MATITKRGMASVSGCVGAFDVIIYPVQQSVKLTHNFSEDITQDAAGQDAAWKGQNEHVMADIALKLLDQTAPSGSTAAHAKAGGAFLAPYAIVTLSGFDLAVLNTTYQVVNGAEIDLGNTKVGDISFKLRRYVDATQNTLAATTPG